MDQHDGPATIVELSSQCASMFSVISHAAVESNDQARSVFTVEGFDPADFKDLSARFHVWADNIGALQRNRSSLDYRLRNSDIRQELVRLVKQTLSALKDLEMIVSMERPQETWSTGAKTRFEQAEAEDDVSESSSDDDGGEHESTMMTESSQLCAIINDAIGNLLKLSLLIQKSSRRARFKASSTDRPYDAHYDIQHVQEMFPFAVADTALVEKLGNANAQRRQWLSYRRHHREKLSTTFGMSNMTMRNLANDPFIEVRSRTDGRTTIQSAVATSSYALESHSKLEESTVASTLDEDRLSHELALEGNNAPATISTDLATSSAGENPLVVPQPPQGYDQGPFECPYCFRIAVAPNRRSWEKHVHADLASYVCTHAHCDETPFESRNEWLQHELEAHRREWTCPVCFVSTTSARKFKSHVVETHEDLVSKQQPDTLVHLNSEALVEIAATECPLCDYNNILQARYKRSGTIMIKVTHFMRHLGCHLEQLALFALPMSADSYEDDNSDTLASEDGSENSADSRNAVDDDYEVDLWRFGTKTPLEILAEMNLGSGHSPEMLGQAPSLALRWQPSQNFTPPKSDFETANPELMPKREEPLFGGDLFTPGWTRRSGHDKEGYCARCPDGHWVNIPKGTYEFHLTYLHGLPSTGIALPRPSELREVSPQSGKWEGFCEDCQAWRMLKKTTRGWNWFRHCLTEHKSTHISDEPAQTSGSSSKDHSSYLARAIRLLRNCDSEAYVDLIRSRPFIVRERASGLKTLLHLSAEAGFGELVKKTIEVYQQLSPAEFRGAANSRDINGMTPMVLAAGQGNYDAVEALIAAEVDVNATTESGHTALDLAANAGYHDLAKLLLERGADVRISILFSGMYLQATHKATPPGPPQPITEAIDDVEEIDQSKFLVSARANDAKKAEECIRNGADIEMTAGDGRDALMIASASGGEDVVTLLLSMGANIDATDHKGWTALMHAVRDGRIGMTSLLLDRGADVNHISADHSNALCEAAQKGSTGILKLLLDAGADLENRSSYDWTALMHACHLGHLENAKLLLAFGASAEVISDRDVSPMLLAAAKGYAEICKVLLGAGASTESAWASKAPTDEPSGDASPPIERPLPVGWTPIMVACQGGHVDVVRILLNRNADLDLTSPLEKTALGIAKENGRTEIVKILEAHTGQSKSGR